MAFIDWNESYSVQIVSMDDQHKKLVAIINELHEHQKQGKSKEVMDKTLKSLVAYTRTHFLAEEKVMEQANYPKLADHKQNHQKLISNVSDYLKKYQAGESITAIGLLKFLHDWLLKHIVQEDMYYGKFITNNEKVKANV